ncbi:hypothetical protein MNEG_6940 [Monoraphidium neglectum]|uniref:Uncharacterized protein n=1 Tax=Monoraphidium neglectum TaxID=145388 RepID=A0A0D2MCT6_9CHLO|nr:hypothetical protein MNEG_6940 [Monoraphidium neglectum]KIZ01025.1 hypothetical protein MNEG_6940 [Monoraphidium neglectum]|eukprot:XP_013900044.1 hypothetical protein MNEG_6940 [Monoraphidium neglectum]
MTDGSPSSRRSSGRSSRGWPTQAAAWPLLLLAAAAAVAPARPAAAAKGAEEAGAAAAGNRYDPWRYNQACKYSAQGIPASLFTNGLDNGVDFLFPLETSKAVRMYERPWEACFGPLETYSMAAIAAGMKLPCRYQVEKDGSYSYEEEHACDVLIKSNCYCYALDRFVGSYCEPGLGGTGKRGPRR